MFDTHLIKCIHCQKNIYFKYNSFEFMKNPNKIFRCDFCRKLTAIQNWRIKKIPPKPPLQQKTSKTWEIKGI